MYTHVQVAVPWRDLWASMHMHVHVGCMYTCTLTKNSCFCKELDLVIERDDSLRLYFACREWFLSRVALNCSTL